MNAEQLRRYLEYYRDLGFRHLYRRQTVIRPRPHEAATETADRPAADPPQPSSAPLHASVPEPQPSQPSQQAIFEELLPVLGSRENDSLEKILEDIGDCRRCRLHESRSRIVFGDGNPQAKVVFVGEGPGAEEDAQGIPFVGRAGQLLTQMIENTAQREGIPLKRADVYICNVVKCRPPNNRTPRPDEIETCSPFLFRQLEVIRPKVIVALGATAARALLGEREGVTKLRGKWYRWRDIPVMVTYHPSFLLRPTGQAAKREAWEDLKKVFHYAYD